ncbi:MBL fold metallo-hydrolase [Isosphaeraceae bacterium EP7]
MPEPAHRIVTVESSAFAQNAFVLWRPGRTDALVVDPGFDTRQILDLLAEEGLTPAAILNTHGHVDHIVGNRPMKKAFPEAPLVIGRNDAPMLDDPDLNLSGAFGMPVTSPPADRLVDHGDRLDLAGFSMEVREIPGHSVGSVVFVVDGVSGDEAEAPFVLGGDVLFAGSVGRHDFPGGDGPLLFAGIRSKLFDLPDATVVHPGHGPDTTVGRERRSNPFVGERAGFVPLGG